MPMLNKKTEIVMTTAERLSTLVKTTPQKAKTEHNKYMIEIVAAGENPREPIFNAMWSLLLLKGGLPLANLKIISNTVSVIGNPRIITGPSRAKTLFADA